MSENRRFHTPRDWHGANFETLSEYVQGMKDGVHYLPALEEIVEALKASDCPMSLDEKCRIMDLIAAKSKAREMENPNSIMAAIYGWKARGGNPIPQWCEAQKGIIKSLHHVSAQGVAASSKSLEPDFSHLILFDRPDVLMDALRKFIEADGRKASEIGAMFFRCRLLKYISGNPSEAEAKSAFKISVKWSGVQNYMPKSVHAQNYDAAFELADRLKLLDNEPDLPY